MKVNPAQATAKFPAVARLPGNSKLPLGAVGASATRRVSAGVTALAFALNSLPS